ncbi:nuclear transport factor 2 family protein [Bradyrhizobium sp. GCM10027634]|uniref:nuclear transport factor 2 family protein n=1 Tax=unclassified Bradyrhizobium TaxID=2631580 RepID=UPI00263AE627|nr:nuclear transport factor 2 family protein [Bradyrhizobium sp. WYCCWR 12677]MDN5005488.1 nuclear transport factor 2 family protein [Bradyrhizobium sp. WYCCWR 12677]
MSEKTDIAEAVSNQIVSADQARIAALLNRDRQALQDIISDQLIYVHSSGREETKELYVERVAKGEYDYRSFVITRRDLRVLNDFVFDNGDSEIDIVVNGQLREIAGRYLMVWKREDGRWRLFRFHSAPIPRPATDK